MAPSTSACTTTIETQPTRIERESNKKEIIRDEIFRRFDKPFGLEQHQFNRLVLSSAHIGLAYVLYTQEVPWSSIILFGAPYGYLGGLGTTIGAHRYWTHKTFKANLPLQVMLMIMQTISFQLPIYKWSLDHRIHHKYTDTDSDPHNSKRGFWFSHMSWLLQPKKKELQEKLRTFDMPDLENDPVVRFQSRYYFTLLLVFHLLIPMYILRTFWGLSWVLCLCSCLTRHAVSLHGTWMVNSVAHIWGDKPFDKNLSSVDNAVVAFVAIGEGWHNYHHTFPWDYQASELGWKLNLSTALIDFFAYMGWAWDLKTVASKMLKDRMQRTGDGSRLAFRTEETNSMLDSKNLFDTSVCWGWDDDTIPTDLRKLTTVCKPKEK